MAGALIAASAEAQRRRASMIRSFIFALVAAAVAQPAPAAAGRSRH